MCYDIAIKVSNLSKIYQVYNKPSDRLKQTLFRGKRQYYREFHALKNVSFEINKGETIGIIGRNGSGKSTILQILAGTLSPTSGSVKVNGRVSALLELGSGFNPEFTGRENVFMNGAILGIPKEEMQKRFTEIMEFADIGDFIDQPVKTYSSGMYVRLAFAVAVNVDPDILIVDEALAVGDGRFQLKCFERIKHLKKQGTTILLVSHDLQSIRQFCDHAILINKGQFVEMGDPNKIVNKYTKIMFLNIDGSDSNEDDSEFKGSNQSAIKKKEYRYGNSDGEIIDFTVCNNLGNPTTIFNTTEEMTVRLLIKSKAYVQKPIYALTIKNVKGVEVYGTNTYFQGYEFEEIFPGQIIQVAFKQSMMLAAGEYFLSLGFVKLDDGDLVPIDRRYDVYEIKILPNRNDRSFGIANLCSEISVKKEAFKKKESIRQ